jgi:Tfp pilus assembly pilus retraction ATPase PilT
MSTWPDPVPDTAVSDAWAPVGSAIAAVGNASKAIPAIEPMSATADFLLRRRIYPSLPLEVRAAHILPATEMHVHEFRKLGGRRDLRHHPGGKLVRDNHRVGKTTLLSALLGLLPSNERLLIIEDSRELAPDHPHLIRLEARQGNAESAGAITMTDLVRQALRMRPDRLVIGEVRGAEISDLLVALNTGHEGGCGTVHANSARDVPARLEALGALSGLGRAALHAQLAAALDAVVHLVRDKSGRRRVSEISVLHRRVDGLVEAEQAVHFELDGTTRLGPACSRLEGLLSR